MRDDLMQMSGLFLSRRQLVATGIAASAVMASHGHAAGPSLTHVASFDQQVTGVAVSKDGRIFVNFPRWEKDVPISVAEVMKDGKLRPYPDTDWNSWSNLKPLSVKDHFVCV